MPDSVKVLACPVCWNTTSKMWRGDVLWCCGNQWSMNSPMDGDHEAERMVPATLRLEEVVT